LVVRERAVWAATAAAGRQNDGPALKSAADKKKSLTSHVQTSPAFHVIGTLAIDRKDHPNGICDPPMHSIWRECTR
jgi:hypothetical protein